MVEKKSNTTLYIIIATVVCCLLLIISSVVGYFMSRNESDQEKTQSDQEKTQSDQEKTQSDQEKTQSDQEKTQSDQGDCSASPDKRSCDVYNIAESGGIKYVCPENYTLLDSYSPGGIKTPVCHMNDGSQGTPETCKSFKDPGCDANVAELPCFGKWPSNEYKVRNYYNRYHVTDAMPASKVCGK